MFIFKNDFKAENFFANLEHPLAKAYLEELDKNYREFKGTPIESPRFSLPIRLFQAHCRVQSARTCRSPYFQNLKFVVLPLE